MHNKWLQWNDATGSKSRSELLPCLLAKEADMASGFAAAIGSTGAKGKAELELMAIALDVLDAQSIIAVRVSFGTSVLSEQIDPSCTDARLQGCLFIHGGGAA